MAYPTTTYEIMIASPSDVTEERQIIRNVISDWNAGHTKHYQVTLRPVGWETDSYPETGDHPQTLLNKQMLQGCDLLVGVFWTRIGTPTTNYPSGTVEEIEEHLKANKPALLYFSGKALPQNFDLVQWNLLQQFKKSCQSRSFYHTYSDTQQFKESFSKHLQLQLNNFLKQGGSNDNAAVAEQPEPKNTGQGLAGQISDKLGINKQSTPMTHTILLLTANPQDTQQLNLDQEVAVINQYLPREQFTIHSVLAVTPEQLRAA